LQHRFQASSGGQFQIVAAPIFDTKVIVAAAFNQVNTVFHIGYFDYRGALQTFIPIHAAA